MLWEVPSNARLQPFLLESNIMKFNLVAETVNSDSAFRPGDTVRGFLEIRGNILKSKPHVTAALKGSLKVKVSPDYKGYCPKSFTHTLYDQSTICPIPSMSERKDAAEDGVNFYHFTLQFPNRLNCKCLTPCQLPPTFSADNGRLGIHCTYTLCVTAQYRACGQFFKTKKIKRELSLTSCPAITVIPSSCCAALTADRLDAKDRNLGLRELVNTEYHGSLPLYSPTLRLELFIPHAPVLIRGKGTSVDLVLHTPRELLTESPIYIRNVDLQLRADVSGLANPIWQSMAMTRRGSNISGTVKVDTERFELQLGTWADFTVLQSQPTTVSCLFKLVYFLEATVGISKTIESEIQYMTASLEVLVVEPPPPYEPLNSERLAPHTPSLISCSDI